MKHLIFLIDQFKKTMLNKFIEWHERAIKNYGSSVIDDDFDWDNLNMEHIEQHFREEIAEWLQAELWQRAKEDIDIANMAFLDWVGWSKDMKIEEHLDHWKNPAMCIDPDNCPVVYASIMHEVEYKNHLDYLKRHWNTTNHDPFLCPDCTEYLEDFPDGFNSDLEAQRQ